MILKYFDFIAKLIKESISFLFINIMLKTFKSQSPPSPNLIKVLHKDIYDNMKYLCSQNDNYFFKFWTMTLCYCVEHWSKALFISNTQELGIRMKRQILPKDVYIEFKHNALSPTVFAMGFNFESYLLWHLLRIWSTLNMVYYIHYGLTQTC